MCRWNVSWRDLYNKFFPFSRWLSTNIQASEEEGPLFHNRFLFDIQRDSVGCGVHIDHYKGECEGRLSDLSYNWCYGYVGGSCLWVNGDDFTICWRLLTCFVSTGQIPQKLHHSQNIWNLLTLCCSKTVRHCGMSKSLWKWQIGLFPSS